MEPKPAVYIFVHCRERNLPERVGDTGSTVTGTDVVGKKYLADQAATLLKFAKATTDPDVALACCQRPLTYHPE